MFKWIIILINLDCKQEKLWLRESREPFIIKFYGCVESTKHDTSDVYAWANFNLSFFLFFRLKFKPRLSMLIHFLGSRKLNFRISVLIYPRCVRNLLMITLHHLMTLESFVWACVVNQCLRIVISYNLIIRPFSKLLSGRF